MDSLIQVGLGFIVIPWVVWVSTSLFNQKQELSLLKQTHDDLKESMNTLVDIFRPKNKQPRPGKK